MATATANTRSVDKRTQTVDNHHLSRPAWRPWTDLARITFGEPGSDGFYRSWIMMVPQGQFHHPEYSDRDMNFSRARLAEFKRKFDARVRGIDIALDCDHKTGEAPGWIEQMELRDEMAGHPAGLYALVRWTPLGVRLLREQRYRYFSPEFGTHFDEETGKKIPNVILGGGLTNRPFLKVMTALTLAEHRALAEGVSHKSWASVNKSKLPRSCFLIKGTAGDKSTWKLPIYEGAGDLDADGHYTQRGALNINGVRAALAAIGGARTGTPMSGGAQSLRSRLQALLKRYGGGGGSSGDGSGSKAASEQAAMRGRRMSRGSSAQARGHVFDDLDPEDEDEVEGEEEEEEDEQAGFLLAEGDKNGAGAGNIGHGADDTDVTYDEEFADDGADGVQVDKNSDSHGAMTCSSHSHGKYAEHGHDGDADHSDAPLKKNAKQMREPSLKRARTLSEANARIALQERRLRELEESRYRDDVKQFSERLTQTVKFAEGKVQLSRRFRQAFETFMFDEGRELSPEGRQRLFNLIRVAFKNGPVVQGQYAFSEAAEGVEPPAYAIDRGETPAPRRIDTAPGRRRSMVEDGSNSSRMAEQIAMGRYKKRFDDLSQDDKMTVLSEAASRTGYQGAETARR